MKVEEIIAEISRKYLKVMDKAYSNNPEKAFICVGFHLYQAAIKASVLNPKISYAVEQIIEKFDEPYECPERLEDTDLCEYARLLDNYASKVIREMEKDWKDGNK